jgi:hypothetical protein
MKYQTFFYVKSREKGISTFSVRKLIVEEVDMPAYLEYLGEIPAIPG